MSYDLRLGVKVDGTNLFAVIAEPEYHSPTYNLGEMFREACSWNFNQSEWYRVSDVLPLIERGIHELRFNPHAYKQYEPDNGWGTIDSALKALTSLLECIDNNSTNGYSWNTIPIDHLYVAW